MVDRSTSFPLAFLFSGLFDRMRTQSGYLLGSALSRHFRAALMEALIQLQDEGRIYAILERNQRCYHVSVIPVPAPAR